MRRANGRRRSVWTRTKSARLRRRRSRPERRNAARRLTSCRSRPSDAGGPCGGGSRAPCGRRASPCGRGSRGCGRGECCGADRCVSAHDELGGAQKSTFRSRPSRRHGYLSTYNVMLGHFFARTVVALEPFDMSRAWTLLHKSRRFCSGLWRRCAAAASGDSACAAERRSTSTVSRCRALRTTASSSSGR